MNRALLKYEGPNVENGTIEAEKLGKAILGVNNIYKKILTTKGKEVSKLEPKLEVTIKKGSIEIWFIVCTTAFVAEKLGITEFSKSFFAEVGKQVALKIFAKKNEIKKIGRPFVEDGIMYTKVQNLEGKVEAFDSESIETFSRHTFDKDLTAIVEPLESNGIDKVTYQYEFGDFKKVIEVKPEEKPYFITEEPEEKLDLDEEFDESSAERTPEMHGRLVTYNALASKYPFIFQPKRQSEKFGRRSIYCMLDNEESRDEYLELMKSSHSGNLIIKGWGIKNQKGFYKKIKIDSIVEDRTPSLFD